VNSLRIKEKNSTLAVEFSKLRIVVCSISIRRMPMDPEVYERWIEIKFLQICKDILNYNNDILDVMDIIDALSKFGHYNPEPIKNLTSEVLSSYRIRPTKEEIILICRRFNVPVKYIKEITGAHNRTLYSLIEQDNQDPRAFYPRLDTAQISLLKQFVDTFEAFRKAGIQHD
jgi:hypothetical protein